MISWTVEQVGRDTLKGGSGSDTLVGVSCCNEQLIWRCKAARHSFVFDQLTAIGVLDSC